jgi:hypothetical protein
MEPKAYRSGNIVICSVAIDMVSRLTGPDVKG